MSVIVCRAKCWTCQFAEEDSQHPNKTHTWMDSEDIEYAKDVEQPTTPEQWAALAASHPCACRCAGGPGGCEFIPDGAAAVLADAGTQPTGGDQQ